MNPSKIKLVEKERTKHVSYSPALRSQHDQLLESKVPCQQRHKLLRMPIQMHGVLKTLQRSDHGCSFAVAGKSRSSPGRYPVEECFPCLPRLACHKRCVLQPTLLQAYSHPHSQSLFCLLLSYFFWDYSLLLLLQNATSLVLFLVTAGSLEQLSLSYSQEPQIWSWL